MQCNILYIMTNRVAMCVLYFRQCCSCIIYPDSIHNFPQRENISNIFTTPMHSKYLDCSEMLKEFLHETYHTLLILCENEVAP